jgi:hypothetical protein
MLVVDRIIGLAATTVVSCQFLLASVANVLKGKKSKLQ